MSTDDSISRQVMKFWVRAGGIDALSDSIQRHLPVYRFEGGPAISRICSTYLDTTAFSLYRDRVLEPESDHVLVRLRWYGRLGVGPVFFEMKKNGLPGQPGLKRRLPVRRDAVLAFMHGAADPGVLAAAHSSDARRARLHALLAELRAFVASHDLRPTVHVQYFRRAYQRSAEDTRVRLTLDTRMSMRTARGRDPLARFRGPVHHFPWAVLEVKLQAERPAWLVDLLRDPHVEPAPKFSKYAHGVAMLYRVEDLALPAPVWTRVHKLGGTRRIAAPRSWAAPLLPYAYGEAAQLDQA